VVTIKLKYTGKGYRPNIPARDLTADEVERYGGEEFLLKTGLYEKTKPKKAKKNEVKNARSAST
jgi:hypothetical protein